MNTKQQVTRSGNKIVKFNYLQTIAASLDDFDLKENIGVTDGGNYSHTVHLPNQALAKTGKTLYKVMGAADTGWQIDNITDSISENVARFPIGIRDIYLGSTKYAAKGQIVTKPFEFPGSIASVQLHLNSFIPSGYDRNSNWIQSFIIAESSKIEIRPVNSLYGSDESVPIKIYFNREPDQEEKLSKRVDTESPVNRLRAAFTISRPGDNENSSPIVKGFRFKVELL